jgi:hypothetical protein
MPIVNLGDIITTTLKSRTGQLADNVTSNNALLTRLNTKGRIKPVSGGSQILQELANANNGTAMFYSGYQPIDITPQKVIDAATFDFKQAAVGVSISGLEALKNSGKEQIIDLLEARIEVAEDTMQNLISTAIYSDGTGFGGTQIGGLQLLVSTTPTSGTVGGFDRSNSSNAFWRNQTTTFTGLSLTAGSDTIQRAMNTLWMKQVRGKDQPDLILADNTYYLYFLESLQSITRITDSNSDVGKLGFSSLKFQTADVVLDGGLYTGSYTGVPSSQMYFLNTKYIHYRPHADRNMVVDERPRVSINQDAEARLILFAGNMTLSNAQLQGVLSA